MISDTDSGEQWGHVNPRSLHKYLYANGDPVNGIDPTGRADEESYPVRLARLENYVMALRVMGMVWIQSRLAVVSNGQDEIPGIHQLHFNSTGVRVH